MKNNIKKCRENRGLTQLELAEKVGLTRSVITRYEGGGIIVNLHWLEKIAKALDVEPSELLVNKENKKVTLNNKSDPVFVAILEKVVDMSRAKPRIKKEHIIKIACQVYDNIHSDAAFLNSGKEQMKLLIDYELSKQKI